MTMIARFVVSTLGTLAAQAGMHLKRTGWEFQFGILRKISSCQCLPTGVASAVFCDSTMLGRCTRGLLQTQPTKISVQLKILREDQMA